MSEEQRPRWYTKFIIANMAIIALLDNTLSLLEGSVISLMEKDFGFEQNSGELQIWIGLFGIVSFGVFFLNWFADSYGRKKGLILLVLVLGVPAMLLPLTPSGPAGLIPAMILYSIMTLATQANSWEIPVTEEVSHEKRGLLGATPFLIGLIPLYAILGEPIAIATGSWKYSYAILGGTMMVISLIMLIFMKETKRWQAHRIDILEERKNVFKMLKHLTKKDWNYILLGALAYFIWGVCFKIGTLGGQPTFIALGMGDKFKTYLTIGGLSTILGALLSGIIMDKFSRKAALITGCVGGLASYLLFGFTKVPIFYVGIYIFMPMILAYITVYFLGEIFPTKIRSTCAGAVITLSRASYIVGPLLAGGLMMWLKVGTQVNMWYGYWLVGGLLLLIPLSLQIFVSHFETKKKTLEEIEEQR
jgi:MFS family permease